jgi:hypothetical protein
MANVTIRDLPPLTLALDDELEIQKSSTFESGKITVQKIIDLVPAPPGAVWGQITGTLSAQTDLQNALNAKADVSALNAHTGNTSIHFADAPNDGQQYVRQSLGWAVLPAGSAPAWGQITGTLSDQTDLQNALNAKANVADVYTKAEVDAAIAAAVAGYLPLTGGAITGTLSVTGNISSNADVLAFQP